MYFTCSTLKSFMPVTACEKGRNLKRAPCRTCKVWANETTDVSNTKSKADVEADWVKEEVAPEPVRFNTKEDYMRVQNIGKGRRRHGR